ncbi:MULTISPECIES: 16S rRNA (guanine(966)-N(2))-methyltransferase RsmD [Pseudoalteromonas]|jgi:16S rRNA (guanine966-N2)-methyltransferase|uniref:Ribosomal RNA small subunit methyltransferase D n=3 Tax=Pseudoalteromonas TaxID=53246 RepID=A0AAD0U0W4_9GAMM|nr:MULTISPECIES: 16S rRNA (guanine(966)-N(2))-methyltransferase RsmD [Pseudoalteromonas]MCP4060647.1 16S rRNA (guanine(966)-N(2))-methyltransferase RsmD [Pseudoalteromonas sp.]MDY6889636.1 16S rRNA (guanine(966)-N(2))-methyltransferase RsmD [Pseudomonadota bacterium]ATC83587.1 16S rRNA (guanine966-N2)-methyltransferase [Pseudoalteromonas agarivorans DSM 14585]AYM87770.1 16S rRNA (guanine(966)-N(2))-methyltransferase RsmD [Pseudoalteromonas agarivorans]AZN33862.1 16S rRNA (guanine(966)-N(2))-me|tara:strand:- start:2530 stop:3135 length:606 start_codon:yes stop_codon:yes gene_type:complete
MRKKTTKNKAISKSTDGFIRVISGQFRGRKLPVKNVEGLRPTTDRIKETVFNWLMQDTRDATVLDCFAGSGGLGFEALSRFAKSTTFIELDASAAKQIEQNISTLKLENAQVKHTNSLSYLEQKNTNSPFNLVFVDPPFRKNLAQSSCDLLENNQWLSEDALIYVEVETELSSFSQPDNWLLIKEKKAGQVFCRLYQRQPN